ncbi:MAG: pyridine nucleotide-disulfide oxidoreductase [Pseudomonadota bacterium]|jgi:sulfide:quinone oxidoreductase
MSEVKKPRVVVLGCNFAGLTTARLIRDVCGDSVDITVIDRKPYLIFVPNIGIEVFANRDPADTMHMNFIKFLDADKSEFIQAEVKGVDLDTQKITIMPTERPGAASEKISYDYVVFALGAKLDFDSIEGFGEFGHAVTDSYYGNKLRKHLHSGGYKGGKIAIGSAYFEQGSKGLPSWFPHTRAACDGPPLETSLSLSAWLEENKLGSAKDITLFSAADLIAEDAGEGIVESFLQMVGAMGMTYMKDTPDIKRLTKDGIEFTNGKSLEAELKIIVPHWNAHDFMKELSIVDEAGFVITDLTMRNETYKNVFAVGDCAALTVPKLGGIGDLQARIVAKQLGKDMGKVKGEDADKPFWPEVVCFGDMGNNKAFYIHSDVWYGGKTQILKMGHSLFAMKMAFKEMYYLKGGKVPGWGMPLTEFIVDKIL